MSVSNGKIIAPVSIEDVKRIKIEIQNGDEILNVIYSDYSTKSFDSSNCRITSYYDGEYTLPLNKVDEFSDFTGSSYNAQRYFEVED